MDRARLLVFLKGEECTEDILSISQDPRLALYLIRFRAKPDIDYRYRPTEVMIYYPKPLDPHHYSIIYKEKPFYGLTAIYRYEQAGYWYLVKDSRHWFIKDDELKASHSVLEFEESAGVLAYLKELSFLNQLRDDDGNQILAKRYGSIDFVPDASVLGLYLCGAGANAGSSGISSRVIIFPFGCNKSQKKAVMNALSGKLSVVQGPPGTGKTQTILTIIANLLYQGKTAEIVSNNNSAVDNIREKLEKHGLAFILATLGSSENKKQFIASQSGQYPALDGWHMEIGERRSCAQRIAELSKELDEYFDSQERLQVIIAEKARLDTEARHFGEMLGGQSASWHPYENRTGIDAERILYLIQEYGAYFNKHDRFSLIRRIIAAFVHKSMDWAQAGKDSGSIISYLQWRYYGLHSAELDAEICTLRDRIRDFHMDEKQEELSGLSMKLLMAALSGRFGRKEKRPVFTEEDLWKSPEAIIREYPIVTSTAFSSIASLHSVMYDYVIIDESSQCDIATGALSLLSARNAVIVGDVKQLQNIVTEEDKEASDAIFRRYDSLADAYRYSSNSLLSSITALFPDIPSVLLCEHYRCQPRIIGFCNEKFYDNRLVIMTEDRKRKDEIMLFLTAPGYHSREHANLRQAEIIAKEILPMLPDSGSIGIITPYHNNVDLIRATICRDDIQVATIHSFQGREMDTIIFSTSDDIITDFSDSAMLINVAVSRARDRFILVASSERQPEKSNLHDLISYISYNSFQPIRSSITSVFDMLYEQSAAARVGFLSRHRKISDYDSENLMYSLLEDIISETRYKGFGFRIACHYPVRYLFRAVDGLPEDERQYLERRWTHVDFLIYRSIGKEPVAAIEVDGFHFHKRGSRQHARDQLKDSLFERFGLPLLRFKTNGSGEEQAIRAFLDRYISS